MAKNDVVIKIDGDSSGLEKAIEASEDAVKNLSKTNQTAVSQLDKFTGGMATSFVQAKAGITQLIKGLNLTKVAIIGTGIGALVVVIGSLVSYFTQTKRGAELLERATASLGAVMGVLTDTLSHLGEFFVSVFTEPKKTITELGDTLQTFVMDKVDQLLEGLGLLGSAIKKAFSGDLSGALDDAQAGFVKVTDSAMSLNPVTAIGYNIAAGFKQAAEDATEAAEAAFRLKEAEQALNDSRRETLVETAKQRAEIKRLNLIAEDTTKTIEERIAAAERAGQIERNLFERRRAEAEEALRIRQEQNALSESGAEDLQAEAELEAEVYQLQSESLELQTTLQNKLNTLKQEKAQIDHDANKQQLAGYEARQAAALQTANVERELILGTAALQSRVEQNASDERKRRFKEEAALYAELAHERLKQTTDAVAGILSIVDSINTLFAKDEEKRARKSFKIQKAAGISAATIATANAIADALAKDATFPGSRFLAAAAAGAAGAAQIATIARQQFQGGGAPSTDINAPNLSDPGTTNTGAPSFQIPTQDAFRSYVLASDVNTAQQASQKVKDQALLLG